MSDLKLRLKRAKTEDVVGIVDVFMDAFSDEFMRKLFPPGENGLGKKYQLEAWTDFVRPPQDRKTQQCDVYVLKYNDGVYADETIRSDKRNDNKSECKVRTIQAVAMFWTIKPDDGGAWPWDKRWPPALPGMDASLLDSFFQGMANQHESMMGSESHIYLEIIMTHSSFRRRGLASTLLAEICSLADETGLPVYLDAEEDAMSLYRRHGFVQADVPRTSSVMHPMKRPAARVRPVEVGTSIKRQ